MSTQSGRVSGVLTRVLRAGYLAVGGWCALMAVTPLLALLSRPDYWSSDWWVVIQLLMPGFSWFYWDQIDAVITKIVVPPLALVMAWLCVVIALGIARGQTRWLRLGAWALLLCLIDPAIWTFLLGRIVHGVLHYPNEAQNYAGIWPLWLVLWLMSLFPLVLIILTRRWGARMRAAAVMPEAPEPSEMQETLETLDVPEASKEPDIPATS